MSAAPICDTLTMKELLVRTLMLEDRKPQDIGDEEPLFGGGLDLDSVDALELALALKAEFGIELKADNPDNARIFESVRTLTEFVVREGGR